MAWSTQQLVIVFFSVCILMSTGMEVKYLKYCGPPDKTFKYHVTPWPVLTPGKPVNASVTFTPAVDVFSPSLHCELKSKDGKFIFRDTQEISCDAAPQICNLAKGETYSLSYNRQRLKPIPSGFKGTLIGKLELYNEHHVMWFCVQAEAVV